MSTTRFRKKAGRDIFRMRMRQDSGWVVISGILPVLEKPRNIKVRRQNVNFSHVHISV